jgi:hypothetical protein
MISSRVLPAGIRMDCDGLENFQRSNQTAGIAISLKSRNAFSLSLGGNMRKPSIFELWGW